MYLLQPLESTLLSVNSLPFHDISMLFVARLLLGYECNIYI